MYEKEVLTGDLQGSKRVLDYIQVEHLNAEEPTNATDLKKVGVYFKEDNGSGK